MRFFTLLGRDTKHSRSCVYFGNCFLCFSEMFFPQTWVVSSHTSAIKCSVEGLRGTLYSSLKLSLSEKISPLQFSALWTLVALASPDPLLYLLKARRQLGPCSLCFSLETLPRKKLAIVGLTSLVSPLSGIAILCYLMLCLKTVVSFTLSSFSVARDRGQIYPLLFHLPRSPITTSSHLIITIILYVRYDYPQFIDWGELGLRERVILELRGRIM